MTVKNNKKLKSSTYWTDRLGIHLENFGSSNLPIFVVNSESVKDAFSRICRSDKILAQCMFETFYREFAKLNGVVHLTSKKLGMSQSDVNFAMASMFGHK